jgi:serine/threonine-protein kinase
MNDLRAQLQSTLGTAYTVDRELGGGGMSRVFVAEEVALRRTVVVKVLPPEMSGALSGERFRREIHVAARLQHPHIVPLLSAGHSDELLYFMMPFVSGESLRVRLGRAEVPIAEAVRILRDVAGALAYAHKHGVVHRDIKPDNILLGEGHAVVTDFGVAKAVSTATEAGPGTSIGVAVGTPAYMAPEQAAADPSADHRVDIYAFGVLAYELLAGEPPFRGSTAHELIAAHMTRTPDVVSARRPNVTEALSALVMCCLEKRPADRPQTADEIVRALEEAMIPGAHAPRYASGGRRLPRRRRAWVSLGIATAGVAALAAALVASGLVSRPRPDPVPMDERLIAVVPFRVAGADPSLHFLREGMIDMLAAKLTGPTRIVDPRSVLAAWRAAGGSDAIDIDRTAAIRLARKLGAGEVLLGEVTGGSDGVIFRASLVPVEQGTTRDATIEGNQNNISRLVDRLAIQLLALRAAEDMDALGGLDGIPFPAIRDYLEGQALARGREYKAAYDRFTAAVRADPDFAAAWYGVLDMDGWVSNTPEEAEKALSRLRDRLSPAARAIVDARVGPSYPASPTNAERRRLAERATRIAPENPHVWQYLGEQLFHWGPAQGLEDANERAIAALERALALDPTYSPSLEHLPQLYFEQGDTVAMRRALAQTVRHAVGVGINEVLAPAVLDDAVRDSQWRAMAERDVSVLPTMRFMAEELGFSQRTVDSLLVRRAASAITDSARLAAVWSLSIYSHSRGQPNRAVQLHRREPQAIRQPNVAVDVVFDRLFADADSILAEAARRTLDSRLGSKGAPDRGSWMAAALYDLDKGNPKTARMAIERLRGASRRDCSRTAPTLCTDYALMLEAILAANDSRPNGRELLSQLDSVLIEGPVQSGMLLQVGNLVAARLWEQAGHPARALAAIRRRVRLYEDPRFLATYMREEGRLAAITGDRDGAVRAYRHYLVLYEDAEPSLQPQVESVRRELARLEHEPGR